MTRVNVVVSGGDSVEQIWASAKVEVYRVSVSKAHVSFGFVKVAGRPNRKLIRELSQTHFRSWGVLQSPFVLSIDMGLEFLNRQSDKTKLL